MYVRLAFAVAAHLEPEILVVDEVLAVGDAEFQKKCLGKMGDVSRREGRTVLFVSHNMGAVASLCGSAILLDAGRIIGAGDAERVIQSYAASVLETGRVEFPASPDRPCITAVSIDIEALRDGNLSAVDRILLSFCISQPDRRNRHFHARSGDSDMGQQRPLSSQRGAAGIRGSRRADLPFDGASAHSSSYLVSVWLSDWHHDFDVKRDILSFPFRPGHSTMLRPPPSANGYVEWPAVWDLQDLAPASSEKALLQIPFFDAVARRWLTATMLSAPMWRNPVRRDPARAGHLDRHSDIPAPAKPPVMPGMGCSLPRRRARRNHRHRSDARLRMAADRRPDHKPVFSASSGVTHPFRI